MQENFLHREAVNRPLDLISHRLRRIPAIYRKVDELAGPRLLLRGTRALHVYMKHKTIITLYYCTSKHEHSSNSNILQQQEPSVKNNKHNCGVKRSHYVEASVRFETSAL